MVQLCVIQPVAAVLMSFNSTRYQHDSLRTSISAAVDVREMHQTEA